MDVWKDPDTQLDRGRNEAGWNATRMYYIITVYLAKRPER